MIRDGCYFKHFVPILALIGYKAGQPEYRKGFLNKINDKTYYSTDNEGYYWKKDAPAYHKAKQVEHANDYQATDQESV